LLSDKTKGLQINSIANPFQHALVINYALPRNGKLAFYLYDSYGKLVIESTETATNGLHTKKLEGLQQMAAGMYTLTISFENERISKRVVKVN
jgi:hypothetical protein